MAFGGEETWKNTSSGSENDDNDDDVLCNHKSFDLKKRITRNLLEINKISLKINIEA